MSRNRSKSLMLQLGLFIIITTTLVLVAFSAYRYRQNSDRLSLQTNESLELASNRLATSLSLPLYALYDEGVINVIQSELANPMVEGIFLELPWDSIKDKYWYEKEGGIVKNVTEITVKDQKLSTSRKIIYEDEELGVVHLNITDKQMKDELNTLFSSLVYQILIVDLLLISIVILFLRIRVIKPLVALKEAAVKVSKGDFDNDVKTDAKNEIGELATSFNEMAKSLKTSKDKLVNLNKDLEYKVNERTSELDSKVNELEKFNSFVVDRELKMIELKKKIKDKESENSKDEE